MQASFVHYLIPQNKRLQNTSTYYIIDYQGRPCWRTKNEKKVAVGNLSLQYCCFFALQRCFVWRRVMLLWVCFYDTHHNTTFLKNRRTHKTPRQNSWPFCQVWQLAHFFAFDELKIWHRKTFWSRPKGKLLKPRRTLLSHPPLLLNWRRMSWCWWLDLVFYGHILLIMLHP